MASGNAASDDAVVNAMSHGSRTALTNRLSGTRKMSATGQQHEQREYDQRAVQRADENPEILENAEPALRHGNRDGGADADRRVGHDDVHELEHHLGQALAGGEHERLALPLHLRERDREDDREEDDLQHFVLRRGVEEALAARCARSRRVSVVCVLANSVPSFVDAAPRSTPTPGFTRFTAVRPTTSASVVTTSK